MNSKTLGNHDPNESIRLTEKEPVAKSSYKTEDPNWFAPNIPKADPHVRIKFKKMSETAKVPSAMKRGDIGFDLYCDEDFELRSGCTKKVKTNIQLADMPLTDLERNPIFMKIEGRSGLSAEGIFPIGGIIDPTYRGEIGVVLTMNGHQSDIIGGDRRAFKKGDRVAQLVVYKVGTAGEVLMEESDKVTDTVRGGSGFGSSGR